PTVQNLLLGLIGNRVGMHDVRTPGVQRLEHVSGGAANRPDRRFFCLGFLYALAEFAEDLAARSCLKRSAVHERIHMVSELGHEAAEGSKAVQRDAQPVDVSIVSRKREPGEPSDGFGV